MPEDSANIAGIVLAGGQSSRMGRNKALLDYQGRPLLDHMIDLMQQSGVKKIYVSGDIEGYHCIPDSAPFAGPAAAIRDVLGQLAGYDGILFQPVDMPFMEPEILRLLLRHDGGAHYHGWPLPLYLNKAVTPGDGSSVRQMIADMNLAILPVPEEAQACFANLNTPEEWKEAVRR